jgi:hypothetical protein
MSIDPDAVHRTAKLLADSGEASSIEEAEAALAGYVLQIEVGAGIGENQSRQAAVLTAVNDSARIQSFASDGTPGDHCRRPSRATAARSCPSWTMT